MTDNNNKSFIKKLSEGFRNYKSQYVKRHRLEREFRKQMIKVQQKSHAEIHRLQKEFHIQNNWSHGKNREFEWYHRHNTYSHIAIVLFNLLLWFLVFKYFGAKAIAVIFAIIFGISGVMQILFNLRVQKSVFEPIIKLKNGVEEIAKGNYDVKINSDVTNEMSILIESFNDMAEKLKESENLKKEYEENRKELIANISHDLKTPITSIQGYIETMLERTEIPHENINKYYQIIYSNTVYINKLIDDLFLFSKLDLEKLELQLESINAKAFMSDLMEEFKFELEDREIQFDYTDKMLEDYNINIDRKRINQVFRNIIGNAVKYGNEKNIEIEVALYKKEAYACIDIEDNGPGIPEDKLPYIFDRFYRIDYARTKDLMSTGLGLAIAKELMEAHKGKITVESKVNVGTCFTIYIPIENC